MLNMIEDIFMVRPINEAAKSKVLEADSRLKSKQATKDLNVESIPFLDQVNLSSTSKQLEALKASLQDVPEINEARVLYFKNEIESGNYQINSDKIAKNMLNNLEMV